MRVAGCQEDCCELVEASKVLLQSFNKPMTRARSCEAVEGRRITGLAASSSRILVVKVVQQENLENGKEEEEEGEEGKYIPLTQVEVSFLDQAPRHSTEIEDHSQRQHMPEESLCSLQGRVNILCLEEGQSGALGRTWYRPGLVKGFMDIGEA